MNNLTTTSSNAYTVNSPTWNGFPCGVHGWLNCNCNCNSSTPNLFTCSTCGQFYSNNSLHSCSGSRISIQSSICSNCGQSYASSTIHVCPNYWSNHTMLPWATGTTTWMLPTLKGVKEITTDNELIYEWNGNTFNMHLPTKFSDCFLKVGTTWSPLYPLIFSAFMDDEKTVSFHLITSIVDKTFEGDSVILQNVTTAKIPDNLTLLQLTQRVHDYFKEDDKADTSV